MIIGLLMVIAFITRFIFITSANISHDEPFSIFHSQFGVSEIIQHLKPYNNPPLYEIILHFWTKLSGGIEPMQIRSLSLLFSMLTIIPLFLMMNRFKGILVALAVCLIFIFSSYHIGFSHEARTYSMWLFFTVCSMFYFSIIINDSYSKKYHIVLYILFTSLMLYSHFFSIWVVFSQGIFLLLFNRKQLISKSILISIISIFVLYLPYLGIVIDRFSESASNGTWVEVPGPEALYENIRKFCNQPIIAITFIAFFLFSIFRKNKDDLAKYMLIAFTIPYFCIFLISFKIPMNVDRYLVFTSIPFYILATSEIFSISRKLFQKFAIFTLPILMIITCDYNPRVKYENSKIASLIIQSKKKDVGIIFVPEWIDINIYYYSDRDIFTSPHDYKEKARKRNYFATNNIDEVPELEEIILIEGGGNYMDKSRINNSKLKAKYPNSKELRDKDGASFKGYTVTIFSK